MWLSQRDRWNTNSHPYLFIGERGGRLDGEAINEIIVQSAYRAGINRKLYADANAAVDEDPKDGLPALNDYNPDEENEE